MAHSSGNRYKNWMVTCFDLEAFAVPDEDPNFKYMVYQVETAPETGALHIQGYIELKRQTDFTTVKAMFPCEVHLEKRQGSRAQAIAYCRKAETRYADPIEFGINNVGDQGARADLEVARQVILTKNTWPEVINDPGIAYVVARNLNWAREVFNNRPQVLPPPQIILRKWQKDVIELLDGEPKERRIIWIWSALSGTGKTTFANYCSAKYDVLPGADWTNTIYLYNCQRIVWFDRTRGESTNDRSIEQFYVDMERWSNHSIQSSTKYVPCKKYVRTHVVVTANTRPDEQRLPDRFLVVEAKMPEDESEDDVEMAEEMSIDISENEKMED